MNEDLMLVQICGLGSMKNSPHILRFILDGFDKGASQVCLDLCETCSMDSTFMGMLLLIEEKAIEKNGELYLVNLSQANQDKLEELGITAFVDVARRIELPELELHLLPTGFDDVEERMNLVQAAHEGLVLINEKNREQFGKIVEMLRRENRGQ
ncbi:MAG: STAS domain-containing protein [Planctomycetes bacterium]|nr:STAS domain-containing protein [Planctomycetota bacterium]